MAYTVSIDAAVLDKYSAARRRDWIEFRKALTQLADDPYVCGETSVRTQAGRNHERKRFGPWLITYWSDHAVREVRMSMQSVCVNSAAYRDE